MKHPSINEPIQYTPADHEIFLSFNGDDDAAKFYEWWNDEGFDLFAQRCAEEDE